MKKETKAYFTMLFVNLSFLLQSVASTKPGNYLLPDPEIVEITAKGINWHQTMKESLKKELEFYDDAICLKLTTRWWLLWKKYTFECLYKQEEKAKKLFITCYIGKCTSYGEIQELTNDRWLSYVGYSSHAFIYKMQSQSGTQRLISTKEISDDKVSIIFYSSETENANEEIARIDIYARGINQENFERVVISRHTNHFEMKHLILIAGQNLKTYAEGLYAKITGTFITVLPSKIFAEASMRDNLLL